MQPLSEASRRSVPVCFPLLPSSPAETSPELHRMIKRTIECLAPPSSSYSFLVTQTG